MDEKHILRGEKSSWRKNHGCTLFQSILHRIVVQPTRCVQPHPEMYMSKKLSLLERWALGYYRKWDSSLIQDQGATLSLASCHQLIQVVERRTIRHAALAGACSGLAAGLGAYVADPLMPTGENIPLLQQLPYLITVLTVALVATAIEIAYFFKPEEIVG